MTTTLELWENCATSREISFAYSSLKITRIVVICICAGVNWKNLLFLNLWTSLHSSTTAFNLDLAFGLTYHRKMLLLVPQKGNWIEIWRTSQMNLLLALHLLVPTCASLAFSSRVTKIQVFFSFGSFQFKEGFKKSLKSFAQLRCTPAQSKSWPEVQ